MVDIIIIKDADEKTIRDILGSKLPEAGRDDPEKPEQKPKKIVDIEQKVDKKTEQKTTRRVGNWTKREDRILKKHYAKKDNQIDFELLTSILPNRTRGAIIHRAYELKLTNSHRKRNYTHRKSKKEMTKTITHQAKHSKWTKQEDNILRENYSKEGVVKISRIRKLMPHRTKGAIMVRACQLKITNNHRHRSKHYKKKIKTAKPKRIVPREQIEKGLNGIREYWKYIKARKQSYIEAGYKTKIATGMAKTDWAKKSNAVVGAIITPTPKNSTSTKNNSIPDKFPSFENVEKQFEPLVESITKHIIANKGSKLSYPNTKDILDISNGREWHNFVAEFMIKSNLIAEYFNVPNKFKHIRDNDRYDIIIYDG